MKVVCVIPARLNSKRFPRKVLCRLGPKPLLEWVWEAATACSAFDEVVFAIDHDETAALIDAFGGRYIMTSQECHSATDRIIELKQKKLLTGDVWVNWQGDEPFISSAMIADLLQFTDETSSDIWTLKKKIVDPSEINNPHVVKVVTDTRGKALYFSRLPIPYAPESFQATYYKHIGLYAYRAEALDAIATFEPSSLERAESLEQLRFMENGLSITAYETEREAHGINVPDDLTLALQKISTLT